MPTTLSLNRAPDSLLAKLSLYRGAEQILMFMIINPCLFFNGAYFYPFDFRGAYFVADRLTIEDFMYNLQGQW